MRLVQFKFMLRRCSQQLTFALFLSPLHVCFSKMQTFTGNVADCKFAQNENPWCVQISEYA